MPFSSKGQYQYLYKREPVVPYREIGLTQSLSQYLRFSGWARLWISMDGQDSHTSPDEDNAQGLGCLQCQ